MSKATSSADGQRVIQAALAILREQGSDTCDVAIGAEEIEERTGLNLEFVQEVLDHVFGVAVVTSTIAARVALYPCPALRATISEAQCRANQKAAAKGRPKHKAHGKRPADRNIAMLEPCKTCPGVGHLP